MTADAARVTAWVEAFGRRVLAGQVLFTERGLSDEVASFLPVVDAIAAERAVEELRAAANEWVRLTEGSGPVARFLRARAAALTEEQP